MVTKVRSSATLDGNRDIIVVQAAEDKRFWCDVVKDVVSDSKTFTQFQDAFDKIGIQYRHRQFWHSKYFDTSMLHMVHEFKTGCARDKKDKKQPSDAEVFDGTARLPISKIPGLLAAERSLSISDENIQLALQKIKAVMEACGVDPNFDEQHPSLPFSAFAIFFQRVLLGCAFRSLGSAHGNEEDSKMPHLEATTFCADRIGIEVTKATGIEDLVWSNYHMLHSLMLPSKMCQWVCIHNPTMEYLKVMGLKYCLAPWLMEDAMEAASGWDHATTMIDVHEDNVIIALEVYVLDNTLVRDPFSLDSSQIMLNCCAADANQDLDGLLGKRITRSVMTLLLAKRDVLHQFNQSYWDMLFTIVHPEIEEKDRNPRCNFAYNKGGCADLFSHIRTELENYSTLRACWADMLLYAILDQVVASVDMICVEYAKRTEEIRALVADDNMIRGSISEELSKLNLELQELLQWIGRMKRLFDDLKEKVFKDTQSKFGWKLQELSMSSRSALEVYSAKLEQAEKVIDRIRNDKKMQSDNLMNQILFLMTMVDSFFAPPTFLATVFGMNFVRPDGEPNMPILLRSDGHSLFWVMCLATIVSFAIGSAITLQTMAWYGGVMANLGLASMLCTLTFLIYYAFADTRLGLQNFF